MPPGLLIQFQVHFVGLFQESIENAVLLVFIFLALKGLDYVFDNAVNAGADILFEHLALPRRQPEGYRSVSFAEIVDIAPIRRSRPGRSPFLQHLPGQAAFAGAKRPGQIYVIALIVHIQAQG